MEIYLSLLLAALLLAICSAGSDQSSFLRCLRHRSLPPDILVTPEQPNFTALYFSSIKNLRSVRNCSEPVLIVTPTESSHVSAVVLCSKETGIPLSIRSGGHDYEGLSFTSTAPTFVLLDLNNMRSITIDSHGRTAWVGTGATLGELYYAIASKSGTLAFPAGVCFTLGVGGHISGGGLGTLMRAYGLAADNVVDAMIVTADGKIRDRESMGEGLFWAIRGGGGASFGVILSYKLKLVEVPPLVTVFKLDRSIEQEAAKLLSKWQQIAHKLDKRLFIRVMLNVVPDNDFGRNKTVVASFQCLFLGETKELLLLIAQSFPELGVESTNCLELSWIRSTLYHADYPYDEGSLNKMLQRNPPVNGSAAKNKSDFQRGPITEEEWEAILSWILGEDEQPMIIIDPFGGRMDEIEDAETPFPHRNGTLYNIQYAVVWDPEGKSHADWMRKLYEFMSPYVSSKPRAAYLNYRDLDLGRNSGRETKYDKAKGWGEKYFMANFRRLAEVKSEVDPGNLFWNVQSVPPLN